MNPGRAQTRLNTPAALLLALCLALGQLLLLTHSHQDGQAYDQAECQLCLLQATSKAGGFHTTLAPPNPGTVVEATPLPFISAPEAPRYGVQARAPPLPLKLYLPLA